MSDYRHYTYRTLWLDEEQQSVGLCAEFPSLSWLEDTPEQAHKGIMKLVADVMADMAGESIPEPLSHEHKKALGTLSSPE